MSGKFDYKAEFLYLTTTGRKSGLPREIEIWFVPHEGCYYICAEGREDADWVQNIRQNGYISFYVDGQMLNGTGRVLNPDSDSGLLSELAARFDEKYQWSDGLFVELLPNPEA